MAGARSSDVGGQVAGFAPAAVGLGLLVAMVEIRMDDPWADGVLLLVAAVPAVLLLVMGLAVAREDDQARAVITVLLVAGLVLAALAIGRLGDVLAGDDFISGGGTLTWMLALFTAIAAFVARRTRSAACLLIAALAAVGFVLEAVNWIFDTEDIDVFRALLAVSFGALFAAGAVVGGRAGTILVGAAGVTVVVGAYATGFVFIESLGWGWELVTLVEGLLLLLYAARRLEPGPGYLAFFVLAIFVGVAAAEQAGLFIGSDTDDPSASLVGWPLVLAVGTALAALWGLRSTRRPA